MKLWWRQWRVRILLFLAVLGPGIITANVDNDTGGIFTYSQAGAQYGLMLLWTILPVTLALIVVQEMSARMGVVTGKGLSDLIREEFGLRMTFVMMILLVIVNYGNVVSEFSGVAASMQLFHVSKFLSVPICAAMCGCWWSRATTRAWKRSFWWRASSTCICGGGRGEPSRLARGAEGDHHTAAAVGVAGQGLSLSDDRVDRDDDCAVDAVLSAVVGGGQGDYGEAVQSLAAGCDCGCIFTDVVAWFIIVACAATLYTHGSATSRCGGCGGAR